MPYPMDVGLKRWRYKSVPHLLGGLNSSLVSDAIDDTESLTLNNVIAKTNILSNDSGYDTFGGTVVGAPQATYEFTRQNGLIESILVTTETLYKYNLTQDEWQLIQGIAGTTTVAGYAAGITDIVVTDATDFVTGDLIGVTLHDGTQLQTTITVSGTTFTMADAVPVGNSIDSGAAVVRAVVLAGDLNYQPSFCTIPANDWMVFTNGVDIVKRYDGSDCVDVPNLPSSGNTTCRAVAYYNTALFLLSTTEGGTPYRQRARRSNQTDPTDWTGGTAGFDDLLDESDEILTGRLLGPYLIIYRTRSIARGSFVGSSGLNYWFETTITTEGVLSTNAVAEMGDYHIFVGHAEVYEYRGDYSMTPIGQKIYYDLFGYDGILDPAYLQRLFATFVEPLNELWIGFVTASGGTTSPNIIYRYNVERKFWYTRTFHNTVNGIGFYVRTGTFIWSDLVGSWAAQTWKWNTISVGSDTQVIHLCVGDESQIYEYDYYSTLDNATPIAYTVETKDFIMADGEFRFDMIEMKIQGTDILLSYSTDEGITWDTLATITQSLMDKVRVYKQFIAHRIRFRWEGSNTNFKLEWFGFSYKQESLY